MTKKEQGNIGDKREREQRNSMQPHNMHRCYELMSAGGTEHQRPTTEGERAAAVAELRNILPVIDASDTSSVLCITSGGGGGGGMMGRGRA